MEKIEAIRIFLNPVNLFVGIIVALATFLILRKRYVGEYEDIASVAAQLVFTGCIFQPTAAGRSLHDYIDVDELMRSPQLLEKISTKFAQVLKQYPSGKICFIEKDSGPVGMITSAGLIATKVERPVSVIRLRRDVIKTSVKGEKIEAGDKIILIQDVLTSGFQVVETIEKLERHAVDVIAVIACLDREEVKDAAFLERGIKVNSILTLSDIKKYVKESDEHKIFSEN